MRKKTVAKHWQSESGPPPGGSHQRPITVDPSLEDPNQIPSPTTPALGRVRLQTGPIYSLSVGLMSSQVSSLHGQNTQLLELDSEIDWPDSQPRLGVELSQELLGYTQV
jgi:hypothetical protein